MLKNEQKIIKKWNTRYNYRKFAQFYKLVKFIIGPKVLVIVPFRCTTYVDSDKNIFEPFCTKMHCDAIRLTGQSRYSICLLYGQGFHTYSTGLRYTLRYPFKTYRVYSRYWYNFRTLHLHSPLKWWREPRLRPKLIRHLRTAKWAFCREWRRCWQISGSASFPHIQRMTFTTPA